MIEKSEYRIVQYGNSRDGFSYKVEEIHCWTYPVVYNPEVLFAGSVEELKRRVELVNEALSKPVIAYVESRGRLEELSN